MIAAGSYRPGDPEDRDSVDDARQWAELLADSVEKSFELITAWGISPQEEKGLLRDRAKQLRERIGPPPGKRLRYSRRALAWSKLVKIRCNNNNFIVPLAEAESAGGPKAWGRRWVSVLVFHHMAKAGGTRGGTALPAAADVIIEMKRPESSRAESDLEDDGARVFKCTGRYDTPSRITAVWNGSGYSLDGSGSSKNLKVKRRHDALRETIHRAGSDVALKDIRNHWLPDGVRLPSDKTLRRDLEELVRAGEILQTGGTGGAQDPRKYSIPAAARLIP